MILDGGDEGDEGDGGVQRRRRRRRRRIGEEEGGREEGEDVTMAGRTNEQGNIELLSQCGCWKAEMSNNNWCLPPSSSNIQGGFF